MEMIPANASMMRLDGSSASVPVPSCRLCQVFVMGLFKNVKQESVMKKVQKVKAELAWRKRSKTSGGSTADRIIARAIDKARKRGAEAIEGMFTALQEAEIRIPRKTEG